MNNLLMQFQADISDVDIVRYASIESTSLGAAYLAGLAVGYYDSLADIVASKEIAKTFKPSLGEKERREKLDGWHRAVKATIAFREAENSKKGAVAFEKMWQPLSLRKSRQSSIGFDHPVVDSLPLVFWHFNTA